MDAGKKDITIAVAMHKPYRLPDDSMYLPIHVGAELHPDILPELQSDAVGDNISKYNPYFSELTAMYWLWKNNSSAYKGIIHYRRYFTTTNFIKRHSLNRFNRIIHHDELVKILQESPVIVPVKRKYFIETIYSHYAHTLYPDQLVLTGKVLQDLAPDYVDSWERLLKKRSASIFNMMIMEESTFNAYCAWLFPILFELTKRLPPNLYNSAFHARYPGRISELLLNVWLKRNNITPTEIPTTFTEPVNWWKKGTGFLKAKFLGRKYTQSF